jgi:two-component system cell cycle sensor histidine kinase/response regulator CckA
VTTDSAEGPTGDGLGHESCAVQRSFERQAQGPDAVSRLAGGIGHEFRNLLMIIQNYAEFIGEKLPADSEAHEDLAELLEATERGAQLTNELLAFGRGGSAGTATIDVAQALAAFEPQLRELLAERVELRIELASELPPVQADAERFGQILENLVRHAAAALEGSGTIRIEATQCAFDEEYARVHRDVVPGHYLVLIVSNTGSQRLPDTTDQVFDQRFTTTTGGRGRLGLAVVQGIVESWGGAVQVRSEQGVGTVVRTLLPSAAGLGEPGGEAEPPDVPAGGRVLICEDERAIRKMCERTLRQAGYDVLTAEDGDAGLDRLGEELAAGRHLDLLVSDIVMPGASGFDVAAAAREHFPHVSILLMTGYSEELARRLPPPGALVLEKPFAASLLVRRARALERDRARRDASA